MYHSQKGLPLLFFVKQALRAMPPQPRVENKVKPGNLDFELFNHRSYTCEMHFYLAFDSGS